MSVTECLMIDSLTKSNNYFFFYSIMLYIVNLNEFSEIVNGFRTQSTMDLVDFLKSHSMPFVQIKIRHCSQILLIHLVFMKKS